MFFLVFMLYPKKSLFIVIPILALFMIKTILSLKNDYILFVYFIFLLHRIYMYIFFFPKVEQNKIAQLGTFGLIVDLVLITINQANTTKNDDIFIVLVCFLELCIFLFMSLFEYLFVVKNFGIQNLIAFTMNDFPIIWICLSILIF